MWLSLYSLFHDSTIALLEDLFDEASSSAGSINSISTPSGLPPMADDESMNEENRVELHKNGLRPLREHIAAE